MEDGGADVATDTTTLDASVDAGNDVAPAPACNLTKAFNTPIALEPPINGSGSRGALWLSADQLTAWFDSNLTADGGTQMLYNMYSTSRTALDAGFSDAATPLTAVNSVGTGYGADGLAITADGLTMYFSNGQAGNYTTWLATRSNVGQRSKLSASSVRPST